MRKNTFILGLFIVLSGCAQKLERFDYVNGLSVTPDITTLEASTIKLKIVQNMLLKRANLCSATDNNAVGTNENCTLPIVGNTNWKHFVEAGFGFVDEECTKYIDALFWYNRFRNTTQNQLAITGAAVASALGIYAAPAQAIAATAAAFGLASSSFENISGSFLYELDPSGIDVLVTNAKNQYRVAVTVLYDTHQDERILSGPVSMSLVQGYLSLCLPSNIETQINVAVAASDFEQDTNAKGSLVPVLRRREEAESILLTEANKTIKEMSSVFVKDDAGTALFKLWKPDGKNTDKANQKKIKDWLKMNRLGNESIMYFIRSETYEGERRTAARALGIN